jgi:hypothetical protein
LRAEIHQLFFVWALKSLAKFFAPAI